MTLPPNFVGPKVCPSSSAHLDVCFGNNPHHSLDGLEDFSHVWLVFLFNLNGTNYTPKAHVAPPRLKGGVILYTLLIHSCIPVHPSRAAPGSHVS